MPVVDSEPPLAPKSEKKPKRKFVGISQAFDEAAARRAANTKPPPWIAQKIVIIFVLALWCYTFYVYVGRFCFKLIRSGKAQWRGEGIGFIVVFVLLWCMFGWTYAKIIFTSPGYAKDHVRPQPRPEFTQAEPRPSWDSDDTDSELTAGPPYASSSRPPNARRESRQDRPKNRDGEKANVSSPSSPSRISETTAVNSEEHGSVTMPNTTIPMQAVLAPPSTAPHTNKKLSPIHPRPNTAERQTQHLSRKHNLPPSYFQRKPPQQGVLLEEYRYCSREGFVKPLRSHHCRSCAKCVLEYDHHCPWIGQCVGARNRKFFIIFNFWSTWFTLFTFVTLIVIVATHGGDPDAQEIVIIALTGIFTLFTLSMTMTQTYLVMWNMTTVERFSVKSIKERERAVLSTMHSCFSIRAKKRTLKEWDQEWGRIGREGNIWWLGSAGNNWRSVMGDNWRDWFLPIGRSRRNGLDYEVNPRFDKEGRWRPRNEWPPELR